MYPLFISPLKSESTLIIISNRKVILVLDLYFRHNFRYI